MSSSQDVYTRLAEKLQAVHPTLHWRRLSNWIWIIVGLIQGQSVHLSQLALHIPGLAKEAGPECVNTPETVRLGDQGASTTLATGWRISPCPA